MNLREHLTYGRAQFSAILIIIFLHTKPSVFCACYPTQCLHKASCSTKRVNIGPVILYRITYEPPRSRPQATVGYISSTTWATRTSFPQSVLDLFHKLSYNFSTNWATSFPTNVSYIFSINWPTSFLQTGLHLYYKLSYIFSANWATSFPQTELHLFPKPSLIFSTSWATTFPQNELNLFHKPSTNFSTNWTLPLSQTEELHRFYKLSYVFSANWGTSFPQTDLHLFHKQSFIFSAKWSTSFPQPELIFSTN